MKRDLQETGIQETGRETACMNATPLKDGWESRKPEGEGIPP